MLFYRLGDQPVEIGLEDLTEDMPAAGYLSSAELETVASRLDILPETVEACRRANPLFRTGSEVYPQYTFSELRIVNESGEDDWIGFLVRKNLMLVIDIIDFDGSTRKGFVSAVQRAGTARMRSEKAASAFLEALLTGETAFIERVRNLLSQMEETVITGKADDGMNIRLLQIKKLLLKRYNYYDQLLDVASTLVENENGVFAPKGLSCLTNLAARVTRLRSDVDTLSDSADHLQDAYSASLDMKLNRSMQFLTVLTTVFFPLTIIVGWYGMNFEHMPEFGWKYGYLYVIVLSAVVVSALYLIGKKRKWF